jgi:tryptophan halogenase
MTGTKRALREGVAALGVPYGFERSCKLSAGRVSGDRFLLSVHRDALGSDPLRRVRGLLDPAGMPDGLVDNLARDWPGADIVHFGYEAAEGGEICKVYFEYADAVRKAARLRAETPTLVHRAWKWRLPPASRHVVTDYTWRQNGAGEDLMRRVAQLCEPPGTAHPAARAVRALRDLAGANTRFDDLMLLDVQEEGTPRRSFDLNLYPTELTLRAIAPAIEELRREFGLSREQIDTAFEHALDLPLGHISGGSGRDGAPFVTIYFGVEAC